MDCERELPKISVTDAELRVIGLRGDSHAFSWGEIQSVAAYLQDCWIVDQLRFEIRSAQESLVVTEDFAGWTEFVTLIPQYLKGFPAEDKWFAAITQPPFNRKVMLLYEKKDARR